MLLELLKAVAGILIVMAAWLLVQGYLRRRTAGCPDADILEDMVHGCADCSHSGSCTRRKQS